jgi:hypothetical protein
MDWLKEIPGIAGIVSSTVIAAIVAYIAYKQYRIEHQKLKLDLYDRRLKVYSATVDLIRISSRTVPKDYKNITDKIDNEFIYHLNAAYFLLNKKAYSTLEFICEECRNHANVMQQRVGLEADLEKEKDNSEDLDELNNKRKMLDESIVMFTKSSSRIEAVKLIFETYLNFRELYNN